MSRFIALVAVGLGLLAFDGRAAAQARKKVPAPAAANAPAPTGDIQGPAVSRIWYGNNGPATLFVAERSIKLKGGERAEVTVDVVGTGRTAILDLKDPSGEVIIGSKAQTVKRAQFTVEEISTSGKFTLLVGSNRIGDFTVVVNGVPIQNLDLPTLEEKLKQLKREIADVEEKIKTLKEEAK